MSHLIYNKREEKWKIRKKNKFIKTRKYHKRPIHQMEMMLNLYLYVFGSFKKTSYNYDPDDD